MFVLQKKNLAESVPFAISMLRVVHCALAFHAAAIIGIAYVASDAGNALTAERVFAFSVGMPMLLGSFFCWLAAAVRTLFGTAIFFCAFLTLVLAALPLMMNVFFPMHLAVFALAAVYGLSGVILARYCFAQPLPKKQ